MVISIALVGAGIFSRECMVISLSLSLPLSPPLPTTLSPPLLSISFLLSHSFTSTSKLLPDHLPGVLKCTHFKLVAVYSRTRAAVDNFVNIAQKLNYSETISTFYDTDEKSPIPPTNQGISIRKLINN
jgi:hypothetical protein